MTARRLLIAAAVSGWLAALAGWVTAAVYWYSDPWINGFVAGRRVGCFSHDKTDEAGA